MLNIVWKKRKKLSTYKASFSLYFVWVELSLRKVHIEKKLWGPGLRFTKEHTTYEQTDECLCIPN